MGVVLDPARLRLELARRGWAAIDLARAARLSCPTISAAMTGRAVSPHTLRRIAEALLSEAPVDGADGLIGGA